MGIWPQLFIGSNGGFEPLIVGITNAIQYAASAKTSFIFPWAYRTDSDRGYRSHPVGVSPIPLWESVHLVGESCLRWSRGESCFPLWALQSRWPDSPCVLRSSFGGPFRSDSSAHHSGFAGLDENRARSEERRVG